MTIKRTQDSLIIEDFPLGPWIVAICFIIGTFVGTVVSFRNHDRIGTIGSLFVFLLSVFVMRFLYSGSFVFDLSRRVMIWNHKGIFDEKKGEVRFDDIRDAVLQGDRDYDSDELNYLIVIETKTDKIRITNHYTCLAKAEEVRNSIREILREDMIRTVRTMIDMP